MELDVGKLFSQAREKPLLMIPGPTEIPWRVIFGMIQRSYNHHDPKFNVDVLDATLIKLREIYQTGNEIIAVPGSGRVGLQAAINSLIDCGDKVLCIVAGIFGGWMREMVQRVGGEAVEFPVEWGKNIDLKEVETVLGQGGFKAMTVVHNETTTGCMYPIKELGKLAKKYEVLFIADTVSSLGGTDIKTDEWGLDINTAASHKCLAAPIGLAILSVSKKAWEVMEGRKAPATDFSYDLYRWKTMWIPPERGGDMIFGFRRQPITMPVHTVFALREAVDMALEEGVENRFRRHRIAARAMREAVRALGLEMFPEEEIASDTLAAISVPEGVDSRKIIDIVRDRYNIMISAGLEKLTASIWRIAHMGMTASPDFLLPTLRAFEGSLKEVGFLKKVGMGVEAASAIFEGENLM